MGKELDIAGKGLFRNKKGRIKHVQLYSNIIDGKLYISKNFRFIEVVKVRNFYVVKNQNKKEID